MSYNFWATAFSEAGLPVSADWLTGGVDWVDLNRGLLAPFPVGGGTVKPFCIDLLPGIVIYWVIRGLTPAEVAAAEAMLLAILLALPRQRRSEHANLAGASPRRWNSSSRSQRLR